MSDQQGKGSYRGRSDAQSVSGSVGGYRTASKDEAGRPQRFQPPPDCPHYAEAGGRGSVGVATLLDKVLTRNMKPFCGFTPPD